MFGKGFRKNITLLMLLAFLANAVMPALALGASNIEQATENPELSQLEKLVGERFLICTPEGIKWVTWADLQETNLQTDPGSHPRCALCVLPTFGTTVGNILFDGTPIPILRIAKADPFISIANDAQFDLFRIRGTFSRAPPHSL